MHSSRELVVFISTSLTDRTLGCFSSIHLYWGVVTPVEALENPYPSGRAARAWKDAQKDMLWLSPADYTRD